MIGWCDGRRDLLFHETETNDYNYDYPVPPSSGATSSDLRGYLGSTHGGVLKVRGEDNSAVPIQSRTAMEVSGPGWAGMG